MDRYLRFGLSGKLFLPFILILPGLGSGLAGLVFGVDSGDMITWHYPCAARSD